MRNIARDEIVETLETFGESLQGDAPAVADVLRAIAEQLPSPKDGDDTPEYQLYEDSPHGRAMADSDVSSNVAWQWLRAELLALEDKLRKTPEFYI